MGGVICGYSAIGNVRNAKKPASRMNMEMTAAKIGRSMKKLENMGSVLFRPGRP